MLLRKGGDRIFRGVEEGGSGDQARWEGTGNSSSTTIFGDGGCEPFSGSGGMVVYGKTDEVRLCLACSYLCC